MSAQTTAILCVVIGLLLPSKGAWGDGLLVFGGSAVQIFLLTIVWPMKPAHAERLALGEAFEGLAEFVLELPSRRALGTPQIPPAVQIQDARAVLSEAEIYQWDSEHDTLLEGLRRAEALRAALVGFASADQSYSAIDRASSIRATRILRTIAKNLRQVGNRARSGQMNSGALLFKIPAVDLTNEASINYRNWLGILADLIQDCCGLDPKTTSSERHSFTDASKVRSLFTALTKLPDVSSLRSVTLQHALRYAVTVELAFFGSQHWPRSHSYWLPMTVAIVLRQDYGTTIQRGLSRLGGTLAGLALAVLLVDVFHPDVIALQIMTVATTWFVFFSVQSSYAIMTAAVSGFVVFSIAAAGAATNEVGGMRLIASILGTLIAFLSFVLWPAWRWSQISDTLKSAADAQSAYIELILQKQMEGRPSFSTALAVDDPVDRASQHRTNAPHSVRKPPTGSQGPSSRSQQASAQTSRGCNSDPRRERSRHFGLANRVEPGQPRIYRAPKVPLLAHPKACPPGWGPA